MRKQPEFARDTKSQDNRNPSQPLALIGKCQPAAGSAVRAQLEDGDRPRLLIVYATSEGQTRRIAGHMGRLARSHSVSVDLVEAASPGAFVDLQSFDAVLIGGSVHQGQHQTSLREFVFEHRAQLPKVVSGFFSVSLNAALDDEQHQAEARCYLDTFLQESGWQPEATACFAGAIRRAEYDYFKELVLKLLAGQIAPELVTAGDREYTDWSAVDRFVERFLQRALGSEPKRI